MEAKEGKESGRRKRKSHRKKGKKRSVNEEKRKGIPSGTWPERESERERE